MRCTRCGARMDGEAERWLSVRETVVARYDCIVDMWLCRGCAASFDKWVGWADDEFAENTEEAESWAS